MYPLLSAPFNTKLRILRSGSDLGMKERLESLGLSEGSVLTLIQDRDGDVIVRAGGDESCLALAQDVAMTLMVSELKD